MSVPLIRAATAADRRFIERCGAASLQSSISPMRAALPLLLAENFHRLLEIVFAREHLALIISADATAVGFALAILDLPDEVTSLPQAFLAYMAIEEAYQGRGLGAALLHGVEEEARRRGVPYLALMVTEGNAAAQGLYDRAGYRTDRRLLGKSL